MIPADLLLIFFLASLALGAAPGPDNLFVLAQSALEGPTAGLLVTLGLCTGLLVHTTAVALGVAALFMASAAAFTALKVVGGVYLLYLAWRAFKASGAEPDSARRQTLGRWVLYRRGIVMNITNPKVSIFFLAFLPQFADPDRGPLAVQVALLGAIFIVATLLIFGSVALLAGSIGRWLGRSAGARRRLNRMAGVVFAALAVKLLVSER